MPQDPRVALAVALIAFFGVLITALFTSRVARKSIEMSELLQDLKLEADRKLQDQKLEHERKLQEQKLAHELALKQMEERLKHEFSYSRMREMLNDANWKRVDNEWRQTALTPSNI